MTNLSPLLPWNSQGTKRANLYNLLCYDLSGACKHNPPPLPPDRTPGPEFQPKDSKTREIEQMMRKMREENPNMPGMSMYSKVSIQKRLYDG
jgi:hypothetical protein